MREIKDPVPPKPEIAAYTSGSGTQPGAAAPALAAVQEELREVY